MRLAGKDQDFHFEPGDELPEDCWIASDLGEVFSEFGGNVTQQDTLIGEVLTTLDEAANGDLTFSTNLKDKKRVSDIRRGRIRLLEIRLPVPVRLSKSRLVGRLYACEPIDTVYDGIVILLFHVKVDGNRDNSRQNLYIERALERLPVAARRLATP